MLTDTHVHFDAFGGENEIAGVLARASAAGITRFVAVGGEDSANSLAINLAGGHAGTVVAAIGYCRDLADQPLQTSKLAEMANAPCVKAIGEIGLDFIRCRIAPENQIRLFDAMLELARTFALPVAVHSRGAERETIDALRKHAAARPAKSGPIDVMHCFTGSGEFALEALSLGFYLSFSGIITFRGADEVRAAAALTPEHRLLIETDSPYLAPAPFRGKRNEPAFLCYVAQAAAEIRGRTQEQIAAATTANARELFGFCNS